MNEVWILLVRRRLMLKIAGQLKVLQSHGLNVRLNDTRITFFMNDLIWTHLKDDYFISLMFQPVAVIAWMDNISLQPLRLGESEMLSLFISLLMQFYIYLYFYFILFPLLHFNQRDSITTEIEMIQITFWTRAANWVIAINHIQNKSLCLHTICVWLCTVYIHYVL